jgi:hypothetical protein
MLRALAILVTLGSIALVVWSFTELNLLRRTPIWEFRYIALAICAIAVFSLAEALIGWLGKRLSR